MVLGTRIVNGTRFRRNRGSRAPHRQHIGRVVLATLLVAPLSAHAQTNTWQSSDGEWDVAANWSGGVPRPTDNAENDTSGTITFDSGTYFVNSFLNTQSGGFNLTGGTLSTTTFFQNTGLLTWTFTSIDPATGLPLDPSNPNGFLPPDTNPPNGEGYVIFTVGVNPGALTGYALNNQATIVFDANTPISTPVWINTIDNTPPVSAVAPLPTITDGSNFPVTWSGTDIGSGILDYTIYVSDNGGPYTAWQTDTTATSATYSGESGHTYAFYSTARDNVLNVEAPIYSRIPLRLRPLLSTSPVKSRWAAPA